jgi:two-component system, chemotaxis family, chemotaxis protein CheY
MAFNVLVVDDSSTMRAVVKKAIKVSGFTVGACWEASDGNEALEVLRENWVDLVLTDINMPNMTGLELVAKMKENDLFKSIPVVMVTTEGSEKRVRESMDLGAKGYIRKPFAPEDIKKTLSSIMGETENASQNDGNLEGCDF